MAPRPKRGRAVVTTCANKPPSPIFGHIKHTRRIQQVRLWGPGSLAKIRSPWTLACSAHDS